MPYMTVADLRGRRHGSGARPRPGRSRALPPRPSCTWPRPPTIRQAQGFIGSFTNTTTLNTFVTSDNPGTPWEVFPAGQYLAALNSIDPSIPATVWPSLLQPTTSQVQTAVAYATTNNLWITPTSAPGYDNGSSPSALGHAPRDPRIGRVDLARHGHRHEHALPRAVRRFQSRRIPRIPRPRRSGPGAGDVPVARPGIGRCCHVAAARPLDRVPCSLLFLPVPESGVPNSCIHNSLSRRHSRLLA